MKRLPSKLFANCEFSGKEDTGFYDIVPQGFDHAVSLYLSEKTVSNDLAIEKAANFFDQAANWNTLCRSIFLSCKKGSEAYKTVESYFEFYRDEIPEVFGVEDAAALSLADIVNKLALKGMASHGSGSKQYYVVDFTLGYDQILCVQFDAEGNFNHIAWES